MIKADQNKFSFQDPQNTPLAIVIAPEWFWIDPVGNTNELCF